MFPSRDTIYSAYMAGADSMAHAVSLSDFGCEILRATSGDAT
jgi:hypothetical protein